MGRPNRRPKALAVAGGFFFFIFKKNKKFQKYMSVLENFKNIPRSPYGGATGLKCNFFSSNLQRSPWRKKKRGHVAPPTGDRPLSPPRGDRPVGPPGGPVAPPAGDRGVLSPPHGRPGQAAYIRPPPHSLLSFDLKKSKKIQKKEMGEKKGSGEALPNSALVIYR